MNKNKKIKTEKYLKNFRENLSRGIILFYLYFVLSVILCLILLEKILLFFFVKQKYKNEN